jgi:hypothetical protein
MHRRSFVSAALFAGVFLGAAGISAAQNVNIPLYVGNTQSVTLGSWGSGRAESTRESILIGDQSIKVTTQGLYQGARLDFRNPIDLTPALNSPKTYVRLRVRFTGSGATQRTFDPFSTETRAGAASPFERMRFLLTMADGTRHELIRPVEVQPSEDPDAWVSVSFPVRALLRKQGSSENVAVPSGEGARLTQMAIFGDKYQQFYVGEINIITDETEISIAPLEEQIAFVRDLITFTGSAEGGASTLRYSWDFDDRDGIQEDRVGRRAQYYWRRGGQYRVTLTVSDVDGLKKPATSTVMIDVGE